MRTVVRVSAELAVAPVPTPEAQLEQSASRDDRYALGQFFTPEPIANLMGEAVQEVSPEHVLDPGVGGGVLLRAVGPSLARYGIDIDPAAVGIANASLSEEGGSVEVVEGDFLALDDWPLTRDRFDAVISNPPYIRHHNMTAQHKALAKHFSGLFDISVSSMSGSYVYFFFEALQRLRNGGRLVFITPTEFLDVRYGSAVKEALLRFCSLDEILVLEMDELAFDGVLTTSAITIATKNDRPHRNPVRLVEGRLNGKIERRREIELSRDIITPQVPWTPMLPSRAERILPLLDGRTRQLQDYCRVRRGIATGGNKFFCLSDAEVAEVGIEAEFLVPVVVGSKDLPENGTVLDKEVWEANRRAGRKVWLFFCHQARSALHGTGALRHIEAGEAAGLHEKFNCRSRKPWWGVEQVPPPDFFVTYMSRDRARFVRNQVGARCMTSLLNVYCRPDVDAEAMRPILEDPANAQLLREFGRTYGGGLGKIEPGDLRTLPIRPLRGEA